MAFLFADRVRVVTATTGTGTVNLGLATVAFRSFSQAVSDGDLVSGCQVYYAIQDGVNWECGTGTYTAGSPDTLTRTVDSSSAGSTTAISLTGTAQVALTQTQLSTVTALITGGLIDNATIGATTPSTGAFTTLSASTSSTAPTMNLSNSSTNVATTAFVQNITSGVFPVTMTNANVTLSADNAMYGIFQITGTLTANVALIVPNVVNKFIVDNNTTGAFTLTVRTVSPSATITVAQGFNRNIYTDGNNNTLGGSNDFTSVAITGGTINGTSIGASSQSTGSFTTLAASSTVSGTGFSTYLASPPVIGGTAANVGHFTTLTATTPTFGDNSTNVATTAFVTNATDGIATINTTGGSTTLSQAQYSVAVLLVTGTLASNATLVVPNSGIWTVSNRTSGAFTLTIKTSAGTGITITQGFNGFAVADGTNVIHGKTDFASITVTGSTVNSTPIGATVASTGAFTTLSATSTVSGSGFTTLLSPYALIASPTFTGTPAAPTATAGTSTTQIATTAFVTTMTDGFLSKSVAGGSTVNLTATEIGNQILAFSGTLTANISVTIPTSTSGFWTVYNNTSGAFTLTFIVSGGTGPVIVQGSKSICYADGTTTAMTATTGNTATTAIEWTGGTILTAGTYYYTMWAPYSGIITAADLYMATGTSFVYTVRISSNAQTAGTAVTSLSAVTYSTVNTQTTVAATGANTFTAGQCINLLIASPSGSPTGVVISLRILRTS